MEKLRNNTIICLEKKIGYHFDKSIVYKNSWKYCIDLCFEIEYMHSTDLFLILFSYLRNNKLYCLDVYTIAMCDNKAKIFSRKTGYEMSKMTYREFENWWENRQWYDSALLESKEVYGIRISFVPQLVDNYINANSISLDSFYFSYKPAYPWSMQLINYFDYFIDESNEDVFWELPLKYGHMQKPKKGTH